MLFRSCELRPSAVFNRIKMIFDIEPEDDIVNKGIAKDSIWLCVNNHAFSLNYVNDILCDIKVDPETYVVTVNGEKAYAVHHGVAIRLWPKDQAEQAEQADGAAMDRTAAAACETTVAMDALKAANALARADLGDEDAPPGEDGDQDTPVVLAALEEAAGADKSFFEEMWAAVQHETQERALKGCRLLSLNLL